MTALSLTELLLLKNVAASTASPKQPLAQLRPGHVKIYPSLKTNMFHNKVSNLVIKNSNRCN